MNPCVRVARKVPLYIVYKTALCTTKFNSLIHRSIYSSSFNHIVQLPNF